MKRVMTICLVLVAGYTAPAQDDGPCPCCTEDHRQFDFWVGDWEVFSPKGQLLGTNEILLLQDSCVIQENWRSAGLGFTGTSYNFYDPDASEWVQTWVDNQGGSLLLRGGLDDAGSMVLESEAEPRPTGGSNYNRITWTPQKDGSVRQLWEVSNDYGASWSPIFDGIYRAVSKPD